MLLETPVATPPKGKVNKMTLVIIAVIAAIIGDRIGAAHYAGYVVRFADFVIDKVGDAARVGLAKLGVVTEAVLDFGFNATVWTLKVAGLVVLTAGITLLNVPLLAAAAITGAVTVAGKFSTTMFDRTEALKEELDELRDNVGDSL